MRIDFFEEFPTRENLRPAAAINFPATVFLAARSLHDFKEARATLRMANPRLTAAYWPTVAGSYWVSPFSPRAELERLAGELCQLRGCQVLLDLELPILRPSCFLQQLPAFRAKRHLVESLFVLAQQHRHHLYTAEYPFNAFPLRTLLGHLGVSYPMARYPHTKIVMYYTSLLPTALLKRIVRSMTLRLSREHGDRLQVGLGTIATGVFGNEPILSPWGLKRDLSFLQCHGITSAVIFRLAGLTDEYVKVIEPFAGVPAQRTRRSVSSPPRRRGPRSVPSSHKDPSRAHK